VSTIAVHAHGTAQIRDVWRRYLVVLLGLTTIFLIVTFAFWPWPYTLLSSTWSCLSTKPPLASGAGVLWSEEGEYTAPIYAIVQYGFGLEFNLQ